jgi:mRNA interferase MazF
MGHEQSGIRPALVLSVDKFNHGPAGLVVVLPITTQDKRQPLHVLVQPPEGGLRSRSYIKTEDIRSVSKQRLVQFYGELSKVNMEEVEKRLRVLLDL